MLQGLLLCSHKSGLYERAFIEGHPQLASSYYAKIRRKVPVDCAQFGSDRLQMPSLTVGVLISVVPSRLEMPRPDGRGSDRLAWHPEKFMTISVPGRVNLIGEHIDYHNLPVLPMAIQRRVS